MHSVPDPPLGCLAVFSGRIPDFVIQSPCFSCRLTPRPALRCLLFFWCALQYRTSYSRPQAHPPYSATRLPIVVSLSTSLFIPAYCRRGLQVLLFLPIMLFPRPVRFLFDPLFLWLNDDLFSLFFVPPPMLRKSFVFPLTVCSTYFPCQLTVPLDQSEHNTFGEEVASQVFPHFPEIERGFSLLSMY